MRIFRVTSVLLGFALGSNLPLQAWEATRTLTDDFSDGDFTNAPTWTVVDQDASHPWSVVNEKLILPTGTATMQPTIRLDLGTVDAGAMVQITLRLRYPYPPGDYQPVSFSLVNSDSDTGYELYGNPQSTVFGGTSGMAWSLYNATTKTVGVAGEALGRFNPQQWETIIIRFDPVNDRIELLRDGNLALSLPNSLGLDKIDRFEITNRKYLVPWEVDDVEIKVQAPTSLTVDAATVIAESGGDDLRQIRDYFNSASWEHSQSSAVANLLETVGVNGTRGINIDGNTLTGNAFVPGTRLTQLLNNIRAYGWKCHLVVGTESPSPWPANVGDWGSADWTAYEQYAEAMVRYVAANSHPGVIVADDFADGELNNNPAWTVVTENTAHPWTATDGHLCLPIGDSTLYPRIRLDFTALPSDRPTYVTFDVRYPQPPSDYQPIIFSLVDSVSGTGYDLYANPYNSVYGGTSGFAWAQYGSGSLTPGVAGEALGRFNPQQWETVCLVFDPVAHTMTLSRDNSPGIELTTSGTLTRIDRLEITNRKHLIAWEIRNLFIGDRPRDPGGDHFSDGNLTVNPAWEIVSEDTAHPWAVTDGHLVLPTGSSAKPTVALNLKPAVAGNRLNIAFDVRYPNNPADYQPIRFDFISSTQNKGYSLYANPRRNVFGGVSGIAYGTWGQTARTAGVSGEALGYYNPKQWERVVMSIDPADNRISVTRNGARIAEFDNYLNLDQVDQFQITNDYQNVAWEIDNVYAWYGDEALPEVLLEVENEPEVQSTGWWFNSGTWGSTDRYNAYYKLYRTWADAVDQVAGETIRPLRVGGPAATSYTFTYGQLNWMEQLASDCATDGTRLDDLTMHIYGNNADLLDRSTTTGVYPDMAAQIAALQQAVYDNGLLQTRVNLTEWGASSTVSPPDDPAGWINASHVGAAWAAACLDEFLHQQLDDAVFLVLTDNWYQSIGNYGWTWCGFLSADGLYPKATYNAFRMFSMLPGERVEVAGTPEGDLRVIASADAGTVGVLVYNYRWNYVERRDDSINEAVALTVNNLGFNSTHARVRQYRIDEEHSNIYHSVELGLPLDLNDAVLAEVSDTTLSLNSNTVTLPVGGLGRSAVSLWLISED